MKAVALFTLAALAAARNPELIAGKYLVVLRKERTLADVRSVVSEFNLDADYTYQHVFPGFAGAIDDATVARLRADPRVDYVEQDQVMRVSASKAVPRTVGRTNNTFPLDKLACTLQRSSVDWGLARICRPGPVGDGVGNTYAYDASVFEVDAYIIDTGIYSAHVDFAGRASQIWKAETSWSDTDGNGHGTHVASTIGGVTWGVSKLVTNIYGVKVLSDSGSGTTAGVVAGVDYVAGLVKARTRRVVSNLSLGGGASTALDTAINNLVLAGAFVAVAAGNDNADACNYSPARATEATTVGATTLSTSGDERSSYSNYGTCTNIFAPGSNIQAAWIGGTSATNTISGTSMASPHIAGAGALLLGLGASSVAEVKALLKSYATEGVIALKCSNTACNNSPNLLVYTGCDCSS